MRSTKLSIALCALGSALCLWTACSGDDDDDKSPDSGEVDRGGDPCPRPGYTETGCVCASGAVGKRVCQPNSKWEPCSCPPATQQCVPGGKIECDRCPGETEGRLTMCLQGGTFDCACPKTSAGSGG